MKIEEVRQMFPEVANSETTPSKWMLQKQSTIERLEKSLLEGSCDKQATEKEILKLRSQLCKMKPVINAVGYCYVTYCHNTGQFYIGKKQSKKFVESYFGSGVEATLWKSKGYLLSHWVVYWATTPSALLEQEYILVNKGLELKECVNKAVGGSPARTGVKHSQETIQKLKEIAINREHKPLSQITKDRISRSNIGKHDKSDEQRKAVGDFHRGRKRSAETCKKIGDSKRGANNPNYGKPRDSEVRKKIGDAQRGRTFTDEHKQRLSKSLSAYWEKRKQTKN